MDEIVADELLTRAQAAAALGVTPRTIDRKRESGALVAYVAPVGHGRGGTRIFFRREDVHALKQPKIQTGVNHE